MSKRAKGINPELEKALNELLKQVMADPTATITDKMRVADRALKLAEDTWRTLVLRQRLGWDLTHIVDARDGHKVFGAEYNQQGVIWSLLAAIEGKDASGPCEPGGVVADLLESVRDRRPAIPERR